MAACYPEAMDWTELPKWYCVCRQVNEKDDAQCIACGKEKALFQFPLYERAMHREEPNYRQYREPCPRRPRRGMNRE
jgi:hypothetical protein